MRKIVLSLGLLLLVSCSQKEINLKPITGSGIVGTWQLYEIAGSTGASLYTTPIPAQPLQALRFTNQGQVYKEGNQLGDFFGYPLYRVDSVQTNYWVRFLANKADTIGYRVGLSIRADTMQLTPFCFEGCYTKFIRIR